MSQDLISADTELAQFRDPSAYIADTMVLVEEVGKQNERSAVYLRVIWQNENRRLLVPHVLIQIHCL